MISKLYFLWPFALINSIICFCVAYCIFECIPETTSLFRNYFFQIIKFFFGFSAELYLTTFLSTLTNTHWKLLISFLIFVLTFCVFSQIRIYFCRFLLSPSLWINDGIKSESKQVWWYMFWVRIFTAFFERPKIFGQRKFSTELNDEDIVKYAKLTQAEQRNGPQISNTKKNGITKAGINTEPLNNKLYSDSNHVNSAVQPNNNIAIFNSIISALGLDTYPGLYAYQTLLPRLPVPFFKDTMDKLRENLQTLQQYSPHLVPVNYKQRLNEFEKGIGFLLQGCLTFRSMILMENYVSDWWERYVYLMNRKSLAINSNYYILDMSYFTPTTNVCARAANIVYYMLKFRQSIITETMSTLKIRETIPVCMDQYRRLFSTTRIPQKEIDKLVHYEPQHSQHIVICIYGKYYKINVITPEKRNELTGLPYEPISPLCLQKAFEYVLEHSASQKDLNDEDCPSINCLTTLDRDDWYNVRKRYFNGSNLHKNLTSEYSLNQETLYEIESAIMHVTLIPDWPNGVSAKDFNFTKQGHHLLTGMFTKFDGTQQSDCKVAKYSAIWFDKSINLVVFPNAKIGLNFEHSYGDATVTAHLLEYVLSNEVKHNFYSDGNCTLTFPNDKNILDLSSDNDDSQNTFIVSKQLPLHKLIKPLIWYAQDTEFRSILFKSYELAIRRSQNLDLEVQEFTDFGKGLMKNHKISPDAFVQIAIQLAYAKLSTLDPTKTNFNSQSSKSFTNFDESNADENPKILPFELTCTYEASSTRLFYQGRTETVRSLTAPMGDFIRECYDYGLLEFGQTQELYAQKIRDNKTHLLSLLNAAAKKHQSLYKESLTGHGIDRHLFALYVMSRMLNMESSILKDILLIPWILSTSQSPQQQITMKLDFDSPLVADKLSPGGGFGPVTPMGYGIAYMFPCNYKLFFHVSKFKSPEFAENIVSILSGNTVDITTSNTINNCKKSKCALEFMTTLFEALNILREITSN